VARFPERWILAWLGADIQQWQRVRVMNHSTRVQIFETRYIDVSSCRSCLKGSQSNRDVHTFDLICERSFIDVFLLSRTPFLLLIVTASRASVLWSVFRAVYDVDEAAVKLARNVHGEQWARRKFLIAERRQIVYDGLTRCHAAVSTDVTVCRCWQNLQTFMRSSYSA